MDGKSAGWWLDSISSAARRKQRNVKRGSLTANMHHLLRIGSCPISIFNAFFLFLEIAMSESTEETRDCRSLWTGADQPLVPCAELLNKKLYRVFSADRQSHLWKEMEQFAIGSDPNPSLLFSQSPSLPHSPLSFGTWLSMRNSIPRRL